mgnify:CR=1 FL=1
MTVLVEPGGRAASGNRVPLATGYRRFVFRRMLWLAVLTGVVVASVIVNIVSGPAAFDIRTVVAGILDPSTLSVAERIIIWDVRLPYALMAAIVGACNDQNL